MNDPRLYQIATLASLLVYGMGWLDFGVTSARVSVVLLTVLVTQAICDRLTGVKVNAKSALISGLSLCLLLRTNWTELAILAAVIAIVAKFVIRFRGKHIFNPTNGGLVAMLLLTDQVWVSPGQWGSAAFFAFFMACVGGLVVNRAARADVTYAFIAFYCALLVGRSIYLGEPLAIPFHRLESGALLLFTFFMISDPKTTPNSRAGRVLFAGLVAFGAWYVQFRLFRTNGLLWSLAACSLAVPLIDWLLPGSRYSWSSPRTQCRVSEVRFHSAADASRVPSAAAALGAPSRPAALLVGQILPVFSLLAPCGTGASAPSVRQRTSETRHSLPGQTGRLNWERIACKSDVVQAFRPARHSGPEGPHYI